MRLLSGLAAVHASCNVKAVLKLPTAIRLTPDPIAIAIQMRSVTRFTTLHRCGACCAGSVAIDVCAVWFEQSTATLQVNSAWNANGGRQWLAG